MAELNNLQVIGNVGKPPEMRFTPNGKPVTNFTMATNREYVTTDGVKKKETEWFSVVCWGRLAEIVNQFVSKGMLLFVSGRIHLHVWENDQHLERSRLQINANKVIFLTKSDNTPYDIPPELDESESSSDVDFLPDDILF